MEGIFQHFQSMSKSKLQSMVNAKLHELAQKGRFDPPNYTCTQTGYAHAPLFKVTLTFNGREFHSLGSFPTLRQAKQRAANEALNSLSKENDNNASSQVDSKGLYKILLHELSQQGNVPPPSYTTSRVAGPAHQPVFQSTVVIGFVTYAGECALSKKQAEQNAAMAAWFTIKNQIEERDRAEAEERRNEVPEVTQQCDENGPNNDVQESCASVTETSMVATSIANQVPIVDQA